MDLYTLTMMYGRVLFAIKILGYLIPILVFTEGVRLRVGRYTWSPEKGEQIHHCTAEAEVRLYQAFRAGIRLLWLRSYRESHPSYAVHCFLQIIMLVIF